MRGGSRAGRCSLDRGFEKAWRINIGSQCNAKALLPSQPSLAMFHCGTNFARSRRLGALRDADQCTQDLRRPLEPLLRRIPVGKEDDLHVGADPRIAALVADVGDESPPD